MKRKRHRWNEEEMTRLKSFVKDQEKALRENFYCDILAGDLIHRKKQRFFFEMEKAVSKTAGKCKSKFQKYEKIIHCEYLKIPEEHYEVYLYLREEKKSRKLINRMSLLKRNVSMDKEGKI